MTGAERYIRAARGAGCPADQVRNFLRARVVLQPRQLAASAAARLCDRPCDHTEDEPCHDGCAPTRIGFGGARGAGKSAWGIAQVACDDLTRFPGLKFLYLRKVGKAGREAIQDLRREVLHSTPHDYKVQEGRLVLPSGSSLVLGHFQAEKDVDNYLGLQYDGALIEESTQLTSGKVRDIGTCVRTSKPGWRPRMYFTANPGGVGHAWFRAAFIDPYRRGAERDTRFIPATVRDNRFVDRGYRVKLESLSGWQRRAWLDGDWDIAAGQYFVNFRREIHVVTVPEVPTHWRIWLGFDYGFTHYTACHLLARTDDGTIYVLDEHAERGWLPDRHAAAIKAMVERRGIAWHRVETIQAGHDVFSKDHHGSTIADAYAALGLDLEPAVVDRINGAAEIMRRLGDDHRPPTLFIDERCRGLIERLPAMQHDPRRPEDVLKVDCDDDGIGGDDAYDSFRYGILYASGGPRAFVAPSPMEGYRG